MKDKKPSLKENYTHDQFIGLSLRKPEVEPLATESYFRLEMTELGDVAHTYPAFKVGPTHIIDFPTFDSAVYYMEKHSGEMNLYRSRITQYPLQEDTGERGAQWLYDKDGKLLDCTVVQKSGTPEDKHFFGRPLTQQRFKPGDMAEILIDDEVCLVSVMESILTPEECWKIYDRERDEYCLGYTADSHAILKNDEGEVSYAIATALMKPRFPVTPEMRAQLGSRYDAMLHSAMKGTNPMVKMIPIIDEEDNIEDEDDSQSPYGFGKNPPYSLYQADNGKWGLIDGTGTKLEAMFKRGEKDCFSRVPWEVVTFNPQEGFELLSWYDPGEVWFNFTFDNPAYPAEYAGLLWEKPKNDVETYRDVLYGQVPNENHWLIDDILQKDALTQETYDELAWTIEEELICRPELADAAVTNQMLDPVMKNREVDKDVKIALWRAKVSLDYHIIEHEED